ncbi:hypothetical protein [Helicobacter rappini]|nr:hypothetical protein [Helicobacter rappini]
MAMVINCIAGFAKIFLLNVALQADAEHNKVEVYKSQTEHICVVEQVDLQYKSFMQIPCLSNDIKWHTFTIKIVSNITPLETVEQIIVPLEGAITSVFYDDMVPLHTAYDEKTNSVTITIKLKPNRPQTMQTSDYERLKEGLIKQLAILPKFTIAQMVFIRRW